MDAGLIPVYEELRKLAREINEHHLAAQSHAVKCVGEMDNGLKEALLAGRKFLIAKEKLPHGEFETWADGSCRDVKKTTRSKYMRLAKVHHDEQIEAPTLRRAYIEAGIVPGLAKPARQAGESEQTFFLPPLKRIKNLKPFEQWQQSERNTFKQWFDENIAPLIPLREQLN